MRSNSQPKRLASVCARLCASTHGRMGSANTSRHAGIRTFIPRKLMFYSLTLRAKHTSFWCRLRVSVLRFLVKTKPSQVGEAAACSVSWVFHVDVRPAPAGKNLRGFKGHGPPFRQGSMTLFLFLGTSTPTCAFTSEVEIQDVGTKVRPVT